MKKRLIAVVAVPAALCLGILVLSLLGRSDPSPPTINFIEFRKTSGGNVAVFRATNHSSRELAYSGKSASEPWLYFVTPEGLRWKTRGRKAEKPYIAGAFTLGAHRSVDFFVTPPTEATTVPRSLAWGPEVLHPTSSKAPHGPTSFGIVVSFTPGNAEARLKGKRPIDERIRNALRSTIHYAYLSGWIGDATRKRIGLVLHDETPIIWVESTPANLP